MFDYIGEKIRLQLAGLDWLSRSAGYTVPVEIQDGGERGGYPAANYYDGAPCPVGEKLNMAPHEGETALAFVDSDAVFTTTRRTSRFIEFSTNIRLVLWYDTRKVAYDGDSDKEWQMISDVTNAVKSASFDTEGLLATRIRFASVQYDPAQIWGKYSLRSEGQGLFVYPYKTMAIIFTLSGRFVADCFTGSLTANAAAC